MYSYRQFLGPCIGAKNASFCFTLTGKVCRLSLLAVAFILAPCVAKAERWDIAGYGYSVDVPKADAMCGHGAADHGIGFYLDGRPTATDNDPCADRHTRRTITVYATVDGESSLRQTHEVDCKYMREKGSASSDPPSNLNLGGRLSLACRADFRDGWVDLLVQSECGSPPRRPHIPELICNAWLHTTETMFWKRFG